MLSHVRGNCKRVRPRPRRSILIEATGECLTFAFTAATRLCHEHNRRLDRSLGTHRLLVFFVNSAIGHLFTPQNTIANARADKMPLPILAGYPAGLWLLGGFTLTAPLVSLS
jgi:hypothetical protein